MTEKGHQEILCEIIQTFLGKNFLPAIYIYIYIMISIGYLLHGRVQWDFPGLTPNESIHAIKAKTFIKIRPNSMYNPQVPNSRNYISLRLGRLVFVQCLSSS